MEQQTLRSSNNWYKALTLEERIRALRSRGAAELDLNQHGRDSAERKLSSWKDLTPFQKSSFFTERLASDGLSEEELLYLLAEPVDEICVHCPYEVEWFEYLIGLYERHATISDNSHRWVYQHQDQLLHTVEPLLRDAWDLLQVRLTTLFDRYENAPFEPASLTEMLFPTITHVMLIQIAKMLILELNIARLQDRLQGNTSEERFIDFVRQCTQPMAMLALLEQYPVLARTLVSTVEGWVPVMEEFARRLCQDWPLLCATFSPDHNPGYITAVQATTSALHHGGQRVFMLSFSSGLHLMYKPRSLSIDQHFQYVLAWINSYHILPSFKTVSIVERDGYGWSEYVAASECASCAEVENFYVRLGAYLALLYGLASDDIQRENMLVAGEQPILVDLETLFHPHIALPMGQGGPVDPAVAALRSSVLSVALFPQRIESADQQMSGMDTREGQGSPHPIVQWKEVGTDRMHIEREYAAMPDRQNGPRLAGRDVDILPYRQQLCHGFTTMYRFLMEEREAFLSQQLLLFAQDAVRVILRSTHFYDLLLQDSYHPDVLHDALDRYRYLDRLWAITEQAPMMKHVIAAERSNLLNGDMPFFWTYPASLDLYTHEHECIPHFFASSGLDAARERLCMLDEHDLARQLWIIRASLVSDNAGTGLQMADGPCVCQSNGATRGERIQGATLSQRLQQAACAIGDHLCTLAIHGKQHDTVNWLGISATNERAWKVFPARYDLYNGQPGIALFLGYLGTVTQQERCTVLARAVVHTLLQYLAQPASTRAPIGVFDGEGSLLYLLTHLGILWDDPALLQAAMQLAERIEIHLEQDDRLDIVSGAAGCILALLNLYDSIPDHRLLVTAIHCGDHILQRLGLDATGTSPEPYVLRQRGLLTGYSHGAAGMAVSLCKLARMSGQQRFFDAVHTFLAFEREHFSEQHQNWPDLRNRSVCELLNDRAQPSGDEEDAFITAWCHGAAGIALSRMELLRMSSQCDVLLLQEITTAIQTTLRNGFGYNHSLCHGDLGNLEVLLMAVRQCGMSEYTAELGRLTEGALARGEVLGWQSGIPSGIETPGFMLGLAGSGYQLLRLACPDRCPSVLLVAPPHSYVAREEIPHQRC